MVIKLSKEAIYPNCTLFITYSIFLLIQKSQMFDIRYFGVRLKLKCQKSTVPNYKPKHTLVSMVVSMTKFNSTMLILLKENLSLSFQIYTSHLCSEIEKNSVDVVSIFIQYDSSLKDSSKYLGIMWILFS